MNEQTTLVATLGGQPQVITFTLDLLLARGERIHQVVVVYMASSPRYQQAHRRLVGEFLNDQYAGQVCHLRSVPIRMGAQTIEDARSASEVEAVRATFFSLLGELKGHGQRLQLSLSGGRRVMALTALAAAMQHLTPADKIWHIYTPPELTGQARDGALLHAPPGSGLQLIEVPFVPWAAYFPGLRPLLECAPEELRGFQPGWMDEPERARCRQVWEALTPRQQDVLRLLARGLTRDQAAVQMGIQVTTVDTHRKAVVRLCEQVWESGADQHINLTFLRERFGLFLASLEGV